MQNALTVEALMAKLRQMLNSDKIQLTDSVVWRHREWGCVAIVDAEPISNTEVNLDPGLCGCVEFIPGKFVPKEQNTDHFFQITLNQVPADQKIATIKAFRTVWSLIKKTTMGLAEAKQAVETISITYSGGTKSPGKPYLFPPCAPHMIDECKSHFAPIPGLGWSVDEINKDSDGFLLKEVYGGGDPLAT